MCEAILPTDMVVTMKTHFVPGIAYSAHDVSMTFSDVRRWE